MKTTKIEWTDKTWNPITGCTQVSSGCMNCYAKTMAHRLQAMGVPKYKDGFSLRLHEDTLEEPLRWKKSHIIFVCSMSDLFHERVPESFIEKVLTTIENTPQHKYQLLTKRAERMNHFFAKRRIPNNVWLGVTVEEKSTKKRIDQLRHLNASIKFLSCEPLIEDLGVLDLTGIDWIIVGGESGAKARPMDADWVLSIQEQADINGAAFFFKQWGTWGSDGVKRNKKANGKLINGQVYQNMPECPSAAVPSY